MEFSQEFLKQLLSYDPETGEFMWQVRALDWFPDEREWKRWNKRYAGKRAGCEHTNKDGYKYRAIRMPGNVLRKEHQLAIVYMTGHHSEGDVDHVNRDGRDNRWRNLRTTDRSNNCRNRSKRTDNASGVTGVSFCKSSGMWRARVTVNGKVTTLGRFTEIDEAAMAVLEFRADHGFSPSHGLEVAHYHAFAA